VRVCIPTLETDSYRAAGLLPQPFEHLAIAERGDPQIAEQYLPIFISSLPT
jgi:hypothetical protein